ncbi:MAG: radical SAM protein [Candidatus Woesearchaeota archaeon]
MKFTKKVIFVEPRGAQSNVFDKYMAIPLLGPVYLATIAKKAGYDVQVINENILRRKINMFELRSADILCLSCITTTVNRGKDIAKRYKRLRPDGKTIIGGIHASMISEDVVNDFDQVFVGEAENNILDVLSGKTKDKIIYGKKVEMKDVPIPDFRLVKNWKKIKIWPVMTSRGCPFDCTFCSVTEMFGRNYRMQSIDRVMKEITRYKRGRIFFVDDHFAANQKRTNELMDEMIKSKFNRYWSAQVRTEASKDEKFVAKMRKAGCTIVYIGLESINPNSLKEMNKKQSVEDIKRSIKVFKNNGISVHGMFILGSDTDTKRDFRATADFCKDVGLSYVQYSILTPLPGTRTYAKLEKQGRLLHKKWDFYDGMHAVFKPMKMSAEELQHGFIDCFSDFYTYTNGINDALNAVFDSTVILGKKLYKRAYFPSFHPALMRVAGKEILKSWLKQNRFYFRYLSNRLSLK